MNKFEAFERGIEILTEFAEDNDIALLGTICLMDNGELCDIHQLDVGIE